MVLVIGVVASPRQIHSDFVILLIGVARRVIESAAHRGLLIGIRDWVLTDERQAVDGRVVGNVA